MILKGYKTSFESKGDFVKSFNEIASKGSQKKMYKTWNIMPRCIPSVLYKNTMIADLLHILNGACKNMLECVRVIRTNHDFLVGNCNIDD